MKNEERRYEAKKTSESLRSGNEKKRHEQQLTCSYNFVPLLSTKNEIKGCQAEKDNGEHYVKHRHRNYVTVWFDYSHFL